MSQLYKQPGLLRLGTIVGFDQERCSIEVALQTSDITTTQKVTVQYPVSAFSFSGIFAGAKPQINSLAVVAEAEGGTWYLVSLMSTDPAKSKYSILPKLEDEEYLIQSNDLNKISFRETNILIGNQYNYSIFDSDRNILSEKVDQKIHFDESKKQVSGIVKREKNESSVLTNSMRKTNTSFDDYLSDICMDPTSAPNINGNTRNPAFTENRTIIYEFADSYDVMSDEKELNYYKTLKSDQTLTTKRRESRADAFSLNNNNPNELIECIKGTGVDLYGNVLDINRSIIPIGKENKSSIRFSKDKKIEDVYKLIKQMNRKGIAYHFELNSKKSIFENPPDTKDKQVDYGRNRSKFFFDIDKEGLFKLNITSTSEVGNIPLLTRYENYSTLNPKDGDTDILMFNDNDQDIFLESFAIGCVNINDEFLDNGLAGPKDRFDDKVHIKHGTAYHNISEACISFQSKDYSPMEYFKISKLGRQEIPYISSIVDKNIYVSGSKANAGGRSGSINLDGSVDINIGANTSDRQSMWLDTAGGILARLGRDKNNVSIGMSLDGDLLVEVGGKAPNQDSRFTNNDFRPGAVDIRVFNSNEKEFTAVRIDEQGVTITTPGSLVMSANQNFAIKSNGTLSLEAPDLTLQGRPVIKGGSSHI